MAEFEDETPGMALYSVEPDQKILGASALHKRCSVYTKPEIADILLRKMGWFGARDLSEATLLEPCSGDGALLIPAVETLLESFVLYKRRRTFDALRDRISAFEFEAQAASEARRRIRDLLVGSGTSVSTADRLVATWIRCDDFLLYKFGSMTFSHIVANPPYVRWRHIPSELAAKYIEALPPGVTGGDLSIAFIARMIDLCEADGHIALISSDRWQSSGGAESLRSEWLSKVTLLSNEEVDAKQAFQRRVSAYPIITLMKKASYRDEVSSSGAEIEDGELTWLSEASSRGEPGTTETVLADWHGLYRGLEGAGCRIRVGPALGIEDAFVLLPEETDVEPDLLVPYVKPSELTSGGLNWGGRYVMAMSRNEGGWIDPREYPFAIRRLTKFKKRLESRTCVTETSPWYRTIDRTERETWTADKILMPEMMRKPCLVVDKQGAMPSHGIYTIFSDEWPVGVLADVLESGILGVVVDAIAPRLNGSYRRFYKRFIRQVPLPKWAELPAGTRKKLRALSRTEGAAGFADIVADLYSVDRDFLDAYATVGWRRKISR